jgi:hypothetical protein
MDFTKFTPISTSLLLMLIAWTLFIKGIALWSAAKSNQKIWFIVFVATIFVNTLGLVEITYLIFFAKKKFQLSSLKFW